MSQQKSISMQIAEKEKLEYVDEILVETRTLKHFKDMYIKHAFDAMGNNFKKLYNEQAKYVRKIKAEYKDKYGA